MIVTQTQQINGQVNHASIDQGTGLPSASQMSIPMGSGSMMIMVTSSSSPLSFPFFFFFSAILSHRHVKETIK